MAQASIAVTPKDSGGPWGQRIGVTVNGDLSWALRVGAYQTERLSSTDWNKYSIVVLNWDDSASSVILFKKYLVVLLMHSDVNRTTWNPVDVAATIEFRGMQVRTLADLFPLGSEW